MDRTISQRFWSCRRTFVCIIWESALCCRKYERNFEYCEFGMQSKRDLYTRFPCKIARNPFGQEREAPMPADRVIDSQPFQVTGIDFTGPLYVKRTTLLNPCYIALFNCATFTRGTLRNLQRHGHGQVLLVLPGIHWAPQTAACHLHWQCPNVARGEYNAC
jgi:hypothetical protein